MRNLKTITLITASFFCWPILLNAQIAPMPTPSPLPFDAPCASSSVDSNNLLLNGDFESFDGSMVEWEGGSFGIGILQSAPGVDPITGSSVDPDTGEPIINHYVRLDPNTSIVATPLMENTYTRFRLSLCTRIHNGRLRITVGSRTLIFPPNPTTDLQTQYTSGSLTLNLASVEGVQRSQIEITFEPLEGAENSYAFVDNIELLPYFGGGTDSTPSPTLEPTPTPVDTPTPGPSLTPTQTMGPGTPTPTATPQLTAASVQLVANPPMLLVGPDDFAGNTRKQTEITFQFIGSNGEPLDIRGIDPDANIRFMIQDRGEQTDAGTLLLVEDANTSTTMNNRRRKLTDLDGSVVFVPQKPFDGTIRISAEIDFEAVSGSSKVRQQIRGVVPIVIRTNPNASLTDPTGTFNPATNQRAGRQPGDRGFRPDTRTNLFFRELYD